MERRGQKPIKYVFRYTNGAVKYRKFNTTSEAKWFAQMEGDHLLLMEEAYRKDRNE